MSLLRYKSPLANFRITIKGVMMWIATAWVKLLLLNQKGCHLTKETWRWGVVCSVSPHTFETPLAVSAFLAPTVQFLVILQQRQRVWKIDLVLQAPVAKCNVCKMKERWCHFSVVLWFIFRCCFFCCCFLPRINTRAAQYWGSHCDTTSHTPPLQPHREDTLDQVAQLETKSSLCFFFSLWQQSEWLWSSQW